MIKLSFGDNSLMVLTQKYQKIDPIINELIIHELNVENRHYWLIAKFPRDQFVFVCSGAILTFISIAPELTLDHLSVIYYLLILEESFKNQTDEKKRQELAKAIRDLENWLNGVLIGRNDKALFLLNKEKIKHEKKINPILRNDFPGVIGVSTEEKLPDKVYKALYEQMFGLSIYH